MSPIRELRRFILETGDSYQEVAVQTNPLATRFGVPESHVRDELERCFTKEYITLAAWDGTWRKPFDQWPSADHFFSSSLDSGSKWIQLRSIGREYLDDLKSAKATSSTEDRESGVKTGPKEADPLGPRDSPLHSTADDAISSPDQVRLPVRIFISHSSTDADVAECVADVFRSALSLPPDQIRCTTAKAYALAFGADTPEQLRTEIRNAPVVIGIVTSSSIESAWVLFELGARWGQNGYLVPMVAGGADYDSLPGPIRDQHALRCDDEESIFKLVAEVAARLEKPNPNVATYRKSVLALVKVARFKSRKQARKRGSNVAAGVSVVSTSPSRDESRALQTVGALRHYVWDTGELNKALEEIQDLYAADKSSPEEVLLPLSKSAIPDEIKKWKHRKLLEFRIAYRQHIAGVKQADPEFHSKLVDEGFPCEGQTDREVIRKIERHSVALMEQIAHRTRAKPAASISVEIVEGFFHWGPFAGRSGTETTDRSDFWITLNVRVVNIKASEPTALVGCILTIRTKGRVFELHPERLVLPQPHAIERPTPFHRGQSGLSRTATETIPDFDLAVQLKRGLPVAGLLQFVIRDLETQKDDEFQDEGVFTLQFLDPAGQSYEIVRPVQAWPKTGRLIPMPT